MISYIKRKISNIKYTCGFLKVLNSPFRGLKLKLYFGKIAIGVPYFLPRKWIKNKEKPGFLKAVPIKYFGINITSLGWKTKWDYDDYRFEWNPGLSIVIFGKQLFIGIRPNIQNGVYDDVYWEYWLRYAYQTNKSLSKIERTKELINKYKCTYIRYSKDGNTKVNYYPFILKDKYLKYCKNE